MKVKLFALVSLLLLAQPTAADTFALPAEGSDLVGNTAVTQSRYEDTLLDIARVHSLGYQEIRQANPKVDPWLPGEGTDIVLPTSYILPPVERRGIIINLSEMRIYYFPAAKPGTAPVVTTYPVSIGRMDWRTPLGKTQVIMRIKDPAWYPPKSVLDEHAAKGKPLPNSVPPGPDNPLGAYALQLAIPGYLIHGTNKPWGIGMRTTHGCIRLRPEDIETLFQQVPVNTPVQIIDMPVKVGWSAGQLYLEVHPALEAPERVPDGFTAVVEALIAATGDRKIQLDWRTIEDTYQRATGIPTLVSVPQPQNTPEVKSEAP